MPKGDGQGGNHRRPGRPANELGRLDLLLRRLELHRDCADGKEPSREPREYHARMAESVHDEIQKLTETNGGWKLEALENSERFKEAVSAWLTEGHEDELAVAQLDIDERLLTALDARGVIWLRELLQWTEQMVLALPMVAESLLKDLKQKLADRGLKLREASRGEEPKIPVAKYVTKSKRGTVKDCRKKTPLSDGERNRRIIRGLVDGLSGTQINETIGLSKTSNWWPDEIKRRIKKQLASGDSPKQTAMFFGFKQADQSFGKIVAYITALDSQAR